MTAPRLEIRLDKIRDNTRTLVDRLEPLGISITGVTKATLGSADVASAMSEGGAASIGESRIENVEALRRAGITSHITLIRSPMLSQAGRVVASADVSLNSEIRVIEALSESAIVQGRRHGVILMVELGDLREGVMPGDLDDLALQAKALPNIKVVGIGTNLACQSGAVPDAINMGMLSSLAEGVERAIGAPLAVVSGGNSANLDWALDDPTVGRVNNLRLGEAILLGREPLARTPVDGLHTDAFTLFTEVIESIVKPRRSTGRIAQAAFGPVTPIEETAVGDDAWSSRVIVAIGRQDVDPDGLVPPTGMTVLGASSDHLVLDPGAKLLVAGSEVSFGLDYSALVRALSSPFVVGVVSDRAVGPKADEPVA